ncbi:dihydrofolate reductase family protein [Chitinophagaceae bacterium LB-8]|uniref:Dihydrofolate reductase family protein n=1 Tax=Paraflavisolibacter caeni TaxID=2982496 RepID=A0A9X2XWA9_9BACT|nr:dihydrofolate reductase family protein [Paraflavisolibacter caeni]MCU7550245.1 dihydrofolate reductase family protein [Paraflavisolibacter caeni]
MRKIILGVAVSLDGFIEGPNGEYDWCLTDQDYGMQEFLHRIDTIFAGRKTYEMSLGKEDFDLGFPKMKEYIFSRTIDTVPEGKTLVRGDIENEVLKIKNSPGKDIWLFGGASLTTSLMNLGLVDVVWLAVHPIILGSGKPLFSNIKGRIQLTLTETKTYSSGLVSLMYNVNML